LKAPGRTDHAALRSDSRPNRAREPALGAPPPPGEVHGQHRTQHEQPHIGGVGPVDPAWSQRKGDGSSYRIERRAPRRRKTVNRELDLRPQAEICLDHQVGSYLCYLRLLGPEPDQCQASRTPFRSAIGDRPYTALPWQSGTLRVGIAGELERRPVRHRIVLPSRVRPNASFLLWSVAGLDGRNWNGRSHAGADTRRDEVLNVDGCKFPGTDPDIRYKFIAIETAYQTATRTARNYWNNSSVPGTFIESTTSSPEITVEDGSYGGDYLAWIAGGCGSDDLWREPLKFYWNKDNLDGTTATRKAITGTHEFGHTYWLRHAGGNTCNTSPVPYPYGPARAVMNQPSDWAYVNCSGSPLPPYPDDRNGVSVIY